jgi:hypothetical protein
MLVPAKAGIKSKIENAAFFTARFCSDLRTFAQYLRTFAHF